MKPTISVVIPVYNRPRELARALDSLARQTRKDFEVIVCDDGSIEDVATVARSFEDRLDLTYLRIENSGGPARPRNTAIATAQGEWISFLDSDDWWAEDRMALLDEHLGPDADLVYHRLEVTTDRGREGRRERRKLIGEKPMDDPLRQFALFGNPIPNSAATVRRAWLERVGGLCEDPSLVAMEDFDCWLRLVEAGAKLRFVDRVLGFYWLAPDSISKVTARQVLRQRALFERHGAAFGPTLEPQARACQAYRLGSLLMRMPGHEREAAEELGRAKALPTLRLRTLRLLKLVACSTRLNRLMQAS